MPKSVQNSSNSKRKSSSRGPSKSEKTLDKKLPRVERTSDGTIEENVEEAAP